ncbi:TraB/GumN family protein [Pseudaestuariivita rosea]|uniref:TraB/GumN family protein n=1 Tax=Pseudaestuariivita rosea TaxID=2763263 RepID=UPI0030135BF8
MLFRILLICVAIAAPFHLSAKSTHTRDACTVETLRLDPSIFTDDLMAEARQLSDQMENPVGRLWKITNSDGGTSYLWGTMHVNDPVALDLPPELRQALKTANVVATEIDYTVQSRADLERFYRGDDFWTYGNETLSLLYRIDRQVVQWIAERMQSLGYGPSGGARAIKPVALAQLLLGDPCNDFAQGVRPIQDDWIALLGLDAGAKVMGLESPDTLRNKLSHYRSSELTEAMIEVYGAYLNPDNLKANREGFFTLYAQGRIGDMMALDLMYLENLLGQDKGRRVHGLVDGYLIDERNLNFVRRARPLLDHGGAVIAVGCFHLPGEMGLVELFRAAGYQVERVPTEGEI